MPDLRPHRPAPATARLDTLAPPPAPVEKPQAPSTGRFRSIVERLAWLATGEPVVDRFAGLVASAREPEEVRVELVRLAWQVSGAAKAELFCDREGRLSRRLASWPPVIPHETTSDSRSAARGPLGRSARERTSPKALQLPLKAGDSAFGTLRLTARDRKPWSPRVLRRLATLCAIAASAERGLSRPGRALAPADPASEFGQGSQSSAILAAFLSFAQAQARRRHEPLSLMELAVDRLDSIHELLGAEIAEAAVERVARAVNATIRASDVVARLDDGRLAVLLPNASPENALKVADAVRVAIARAGATSTTMPSLTASIGLASYPDHAHDVASLRAAASSTLTRAREQGHDQIAIASPIPPANAPGLAQRVG